MRRLTSSGSRLTSTPSITAVPDVGFSNPHIIRMAVDLPAPFARESRRFPALDFELMRSTAVNAPNFRVRSRTRIAESLITVQRPLEAGAGELRIRASPREVELRLQQRRLRVQHVCIRCDAGREALRNDPSRFCRGSNSRTGGFDGRSGRFQLGRPLAHFNLDAGIEVPDARFNRAAGCGGSASRQHPAAMNKDQDGDSTSHEALQLPDGEKFAVRPRQS